MAYDCLILGGGAAGLFAASALAQAGAQVAVLERLDRVGKKLLATGNGRCNLSNADLSPAHYGAAAPFVARVFDAAPPAAIAARWEALGLMTAQEDGRVYPRTRMAASVLDVLRQGCAGATLMTGRGAVRLSPARRGGLCVTTTDGQTLHATTVLCAMGGSAAPHMGTDGAGARLMAAVGHAIVSAVPALVQLKCDHPTLRSLKGLRAQATLTLILDGRPAATETGELLFADYGVSGVCVFQLSGLAARALAQGRRCMLRVNLLPELTDAKRWLHDRIARHGTLEAQALLTGVLPRLLAQAALRQAAIPPQTRADALTPAQVDALHGALCAFPLPVTGTLGFQHAQVSAGGVALCDVEPETMASRVMDGLYLAGEVLDVDGSCGGYNLHFAFASALVAARAIGARVGCPLPLTTGKDAP